MSKDTDAIEAILSGDKRFGREAYRFVMASLEHTVQKMGERRHVTGQELLEGIRDLGRERFGMMAPAVFNAWA